jgi:spore coat polysaccharide biosynthesis protein SpsF
VLAVIQARCSSKRFKNKILFPINNLPLIIHVNLRVKKSRFIKKIIIATSKNKTDDKLIKILKKFKIKYFRGDLKNVAKRLYKVAELNKVKYFMRISGDSPLINYKIIDRALNIFKNKNKDYDLITNIFPRSFPKGQSIEIIKTSTLKKNLDFFSKLDEEHVSTYFYKNFKRFKIKNFKFKNKKKEIDQSIDTKKDLANVLKNFESKFKEIT